MSWASPVLVRVMRTVMIWATFTEVGLMLRAAANVAAMVATTTGHPEAGGTIAIAKRPYDFFKDDN
jgi:hypothetical protein